MFCKISSGFMHKCSGVKVAELLTVQNCCAPVCVEFILFKVLKTSKYIGPVSAFANANALNLVSKLVLDSNAYCWNKTTAVIRTMEAKLINWSCMQDSPGPKSGSRTKVRSTLEKSNCLKILKVSASECGQKCVTM